MVLLWFVTVYVLALLLVSAGAVTHTPTKSGYVPNSYILWYTDDIVRNEFSQEEALHNIRSLVSSQLNVDTHVKHRYHVRNELAGANIELHPRTARRSMPDALPILTRAPGVRKAARNRYRPYSDSREASSYHRAKSRKSIEALGSPAKRKELVAATLTSSSSSTKLNFTSKETDSRHLLTGIDVQHKRGNFGKGVTVCVVDSTIDYSHPHLNGGRGDGVPCIGEDCPVKGGYDFIGRDFDGVHRHPGPPDFTNVLGNPDCTHGTRSASIIAGNDADGRYIGVAPEVSLRTYTVFQCTTAPFNTSKTGTTEADLFGAYTLAHQDGCDVLSASLGIMYGWQEATSELVSALARSGMTAVFSIGNDGTGGPFRIETPGIGSDVISVGSANSGKIPTFPLHINPPLPDGTDVLNLAAAWSWTYNRSAPTLPIRFTDASLRDPYLLDDGCYPFGEDVPARDDYVLVLFQAKHCLFVDQTRHFHRKGVRYVIRVTAEGQPFAAYPAEVDQEKIRHAMLSRKQGLALYRHFKKTGDVKVTFSPEGPFAFVDYDSHDAALVSDFSSWGPDGATKLLKPDILAMGSEGLAAATLPFRYDVASGTSFSCPSVSGAVALYKSARGRNTSSETIARALKHTATRLKRSHSPNAKDESNFWQGAGLMNITAAIDLTTFVHPVQLIYGEAFQAQLWNELVIENASNETVRYNITHHPAQSVYLLQKGAPDYRTDNTSSMISKYPEEVDSVATMMFMTPPFLELKSGEAKPFETRLKPPPDNPRIILYSGYIKITGSIPNSNVNIPYTGIAGKLRTIPSLVSGPSPFGTNVPALYTESLKEQIRNDSTRWTLSSRENGTYPTLAFMTQTPSLGVICDIVPADIVYKATVPIIDDPGCCNADFRQLGRRHSKKKAEIYTNFDDVPTVGRLQAVDIASRDYFGDNLISVGTWGQCTADSEVFPPASWSDLFDPSADTIKLPEGRYRLLLRVQRLHALDPSLEESWDSYLSHIYEFKK